MRALMLVDGPHPFAGPTLIRRSYEVKDVDGHADDVLADLAALQGE